MENTNILLVGNDINQLRKLRKTLSFNSYDIRIALDINEAISMTLKTGPDLIILDMDIADGLDYGYRICMDLRKSTMCPIIAMSMQYDDLKWIRVLNSCADHYLVRPFEDDWFKGIVASSLRLWQAYKKGEQDPDEVLDLGALTIDPQARTVMIDGSTVQLTKTEFEILYYLAKQDGRAIAYSELMNAIWGDEDVNINRLRSFISQIRNKLGDNRNESDYLYTIPGFGYRFSTDGRVSPQKDDSEVSDVDK